MQYRDSVHKIVKQVWVPRKVADRHSAVRTRKMYRTILVWFAALYTQSFFSNTRISMLLCIIARVYCLSVDVLSSDIRVSLSVCEDFCGCVLLLVVLLRFAVWILFGCVEWVRWLFLGAFAKMRKVTVCFMFSYSSVHIEVGSHWTDFYEIWYLSVFGKSVEKIQAQLKSHKNNMKNNVYFWSYLTQFFLKLKMFQTKVTEKLKTHI
jgi:hypothetical protein